MSCGPTKGPQVSSLCLLLSLPSCSPLFIVLLVMTSLLSYFGGLHYSNWYLTESLQIFPFRARRWTSSGSPRTALVAPWSPRLARFPSAASSKTRTRRSCSDRNGASRTWWKRWRCGIFPSRSAQVSDFTTLRFQPPAPEASCNATWFDWNEVPNRSF